MKTCCRCREEKSATEFFARAIARDGLSHACKACLRERRRENRALSPEEKLARVEALRTAGSKSCGKCGETKPRSEFAVRKRSRDGMSPWCKACNSQYSRMHYEANRAKRNLQAAAWYAANRESRVEQIRVWNEANRERLREYNYERSKRWRQENPERWAELLRRGQQARRAREVGAKVGVIDHDALWTGACGICGEVLDLDTAYPDPQSKSLDHIVPLSRGGTHEQGNLQYAHLGCNIHKGVRILERVG